MVKSQDGPAIFDHNGSVATTQAEGGPPRLIQDGQMFTFAEYNRFTERWEPEPQLITGQDIYEQNCRDMAGMLQKLVDSHEKLEPVFKFLEEAANQAIRSRAELKNQRDVYTGQIEQAKRRLRKAEEEMPARKKELAKQIKQLEKEVVGFNMESLWN